MHFLNLFLVKRKNPVRYPTTSFTAGQVCNLCCPCLLVQKTVPATEKAQSGGCIKNTGKGTDHLEKSLDLALPVTPWTTPGLQDTPSAAPWHSPWPPEPCGQQGGRPTLAQPPPPATSQLHLLHHSSLSANCARRGEMTD